MSPLKAADIFERVLHAPLAERHERDDRGRTDDDSQHGEEGAEFVQPKALDCQREGAAELRPTGSRNQSMGTQEIRDRSDNNEPAEAGVRGSWSRTKPLMCGIVIRGLPRSCILFSLSPCGRGWRGLASRVRGGFSPSLGSPPLTLAESLRDSAVPLPQGEWGKPRGIAWGANQNPGICRTSRNHRPASHRFSRPIRLVHRAT